MAITLVPKYVRAVAEQLNAYYRVLKGVDADSVDLRLPGGGRFAVHHSGTNAIVFQVTDAGATGSYQPGDIGTPDLADGAVTSAKILDQAIVDADVNNAAAIAVAKLADLGANNVLRSSGAGNVAGKVVSGDIADGTIVDIDVNAGANVALTKLVHVGPGTVLRSNGSQNVGGPLVAADIPNSSITSAKIVDNEIVNGDINSAAGISYGKLALGNSIVNADVAPGAAVSHAKLAAVTAGQILKDVGSGVVGGGLLVDANVAAAGAANVALGKLAPGASGLVRSNGSAISAGNQLAAGDVPTGLITSAMILDGTIATADMTINTINGDRIADGTLPGAKILGGAPPPSGGGVADAYKVYATSAAGTTVSLQQVLANHVQAGQLPTLLATTGVLGAPLAAAVFSGISQAYKSLELRMYGRSTSALNVDTVRLTINGVASGYYTQYLNVIGAGVTAGESIPTTSANLGAIPGGAGDGAATAVLTVWLHGYTSTTSYKTLLALGYTAWTFGGPSTQAIQHNGSTATPSTTAITSLSVTAGAGSWGAGSIVSLYGYP